MQVYQLENKNQFVIEHNGERYFQSYESLIAKYYFDYELGKRVLILGYYWDYSKTTLKHLYIFLNQYTNINLEKYKGSYKAYIEKLIEDKVIIYDEYMR